MYNNSTYHIVLSYAQQRRMKERTRNKEDEGIEFLMFGFLELDKN